MNNYRLTLEVLTPVYIGSGSKITKKDFELRNNQAHIYDPLKLHSILGLWYEQFLMDNSSFTDFLSKNKHFNIKPALKYSVFCGDRTIRKSDNIEEFIKDPYGNPYIPGSSIKGAIRTAILSYIIKNDPSKYTRFKNDPIDKWNNARNIEELAFGKFQNDKFKNIKISDSKPLPKDGLILSKKIDTFKDGQSNNKLNLCRESLKPGTKIEFNLNIDSSNNREVFTPNEIMRAIREFTKQYRETYLSKFNSDEGDNYGEEIIYLGGGTGFLTKTINQSLYKENTLEKTAHYLDKRFRRHKHRKDIALGVSPRAKKTTIIDGEIMEMGICRVRID